MPTPPFFATTEAPLRRVVVTGMGCITPLGPTLASSWSALLSRHASLPSPSSPPPSSEEGGGITTLEEALLAQNLPADALEREMALAKTLPCQVAAPVRNVKHDARTARFVQFALRAGEEAARQAGLHSWLGHRDDGGGDEDACDPIIQRRRERAGACIGSGMSSVREVVSASANTYGTGSIRRLSPHFVPKVLANSAAGRLSLALKLGGPNHAASTACAAGAHAIGDAVRCIQHGDADVMLAGGAEACLDPLSMAGFCRLRALSTSYNDSPGEASRPFDDGREGFVMGEGAAVLVLEELNHARERGADMLCEVRGYALTGDAYHVTAPDPDGRGAERAMTVAIERSGLHPGEVDYVNAHATSTPLGDEIEARVIDRALVRRGCGHNNLYVSSTKGRTGHLLGAAGAVEAVFTAMTIIDGSVPPTANLASPCDSDVGFDYVANVPIEQKVGVAISNSFGFGGTNASIVFREISQDDDRK